MSRPAGDGTEGLRLDAWEGLPRAALRERLDVPELHLFQRIGSTNDVARRRAEDGAPAGTLVLAEEQLAGRGRRGRRWSAPPGAALLFSAVLRPAAAPGGPASPGTLPLRVGLGVARAVQTVAGLDARLKWPNDVLVDGRKVAGILCEGSFAPGADGYIVAGVGINVAQTPDSWSDELRATAASLEQLAGRSVSRLDLLTAALAAVRTLGQAAAPLGSDLLDELARRDALAGRRVAIDGREAGRAVGIAPDGALIIREDGGLRRLHHGTVRLMEASS